MKNTVYLDIVHPQKSRVERFLNGIDADLEKIPFSVNELKGVDDTTAGFKFKVKGQSTFVIVIFAPSYSHACDIEEANKARPNLQWTLNGTILFGVESLDEQVAKTMLGFFAGRE